MDSIITDDYDLITSTSLDVNSGFSDNNTVTCKLNLICHETSRFLTSAIFILL